MKFPLVAVAIALSASIVDVSAAPLRVLYIDSNPAIANAPVAVVNNMRFGHTVPSAVVDATPAAAQPSSIKINVATIPRAGKGHRHGCGRGRFGITRKMIQISNAFRQFFGLPEIQMHHPHHRLRLGDNNEVPSTPGEYRILPFIGTPPTFIKVEGQTGEVRTKGGDGLHIMTISHHPVKTMRAERTLVQRLMFALMSLGPFESKVVAFVLGCGLGVLLRMIWVLGVVTYRSIKGGNEEEEQEYNHFLVDDIDRNAEIIFVAPPSYTDEKAPIEPEARN